MSDNPIEKAAARMREAEATFAEALSEGDFRLAERKARVVFATAIMWPEVLGPPELADA